MMRFSLLGLVGLLSTGCTSKTGITQQYADMTVSPSVLDLGEVQVGTSQTGQLTLADIGNAKVEISSVTITPDDPSHDFFSWDGTIPDVPRDSSTTLPITYAPTDDGYHSAIIAITYNNGDADEPAEALIRAHAEMGSARIYPSLLDFGNVAAGDSATLPVTIANDGATELTLNDAAFSSGEFVLERPGPITLPAGEDTQVTITFTASSDNAVDESADFDLGGIVTLPTVTLRANDCERGNPATYDVDADGYTTCGGDCDDHNEDAHPGGVETADGTDEDCDGTVDEGTDAYDDDGDGYSENDGDCNDGDDRVNPSATEDYTNGVDDDCDGTVDTGALDADRDGYAEDGGDCEDTDDTVYPNAPELADGIDNDCDGTVDEGTTAYDDDGDGMSEEEGDCDDSDSTIYPGATEVDDWQDNDCDVTVDEGTDNYDDDGDGFTESGGDCDDSNASVNPAMEEVARNGLDDNCDGTTS